MNRNHSLIERAVALAVRAHDGQMRKEAPMPYIVHPIEVGLILARHGFSDVVIAAGIVHDLVEDTNITADELRHLLGDDVTDIVVPVTHDDTLSWEEKKKAYIESVRGAGSEAKAASLADKIANAYSLIAAHQAQGSTIWSYFNAGREKKIWFEEAMLDMFRASLTHSMVDEYEGLVVEMKAL
ncbi:MAG: HD domain-containing protein [Patescibacteria group bacterium]